MASSTDDRTPESPPDAPNDKQRTRTSFGELARNFFEHGTLPPGMLGRAIALFAVAVAAVSGLAAAVPALNQLKERAFPTMKPRVALVGPMSPSPGGNNGFADWLPVREALKSRRLERPGPPLESVDFIEVDDRGGPEAAREVAARICADKSIIAAIGYVFSTSAEAALAELQKCPSKLPVMLVAATVDSLTAMNKIEWTYPVLQLVPSNSYQAKLIAEALGDTYPADARPRILRVLDINNDNDTYARSLSEQVRALTDSYKKVKPVWDPPLEYGNQPWQSVIKLSVTPPDLVIFIGNRSARELLAGRDAREPGPVVIVTDGAVTQQLLIREAECVWGTFPSAVGGSGAAPDFAQMGRIAVDLLALVLGDGRHISRPEIADAFRQLSERNRPTQVADAKMQFDSRGRLVLNNASETDVWGNLYHFLQVRPVGVDKFAWIHRERRFPLTGSLCSPNAR